MFVNEIILTGFKNYSSASFQFNSRIVGICGMNGKGKTNLLDAIFYLCFTKSYFSKSDLLNVQFGAEGFRIESYITQNTSTEKNKVVCIYRNAKKELYLDDIPYEKFSKHIGKVPCIMIAPDDVEIITGGSEQRRTFIDTVLSQMDADYLQHLIVYNKVLQQRNSLLKNFFETKNKDLSLLEVLDDQLIQPGNSIYTKRKAFTEQLIPLVRKFYLKIANSNETVNLIYESQLNENSFASILELCRERDMMLQRTSAGIHKDDLGMLLNDRNFKNIASQGQRKSLLFALKLAEFELLKQNKGFTPLLLLDDVFEKLDDSRMQNLLQWVCVNNSGQVFITDTHQERLESSLKAFDKPIQIIQLN